MGYELHTIGTERWLVSMPDLVGNIDDMPWMYIDLFNDIRPLLKLPTGNDNQVAFALITSLLYEAKRHSWESKPCLYRRKTIELLFSSMINWTKEQYQEFIKNLQESGQIDYFGENLSDDSDHEADPIPDEQILQAHQAQNFWEKTKRTNLQGQLSYLVHQINNRNITDPLTIKARTDGIKSTLFKEQLPRAEIPYRDFRASFTAQQRACYQEINQIITTARARDNKIFTTEEINRIRDLSRQGNFYVMQYRGINYLTDRWNTPSRRYHRNIDEVNKPQYSEMVLSSLDFSFYTELKAETDYVKRLDLQSRLQGNSENLRRFLLQLRERAFCIGTALGSNQYLFNNILENLQHHYSNGVDEFLAKLHRLREEYPQYWGIHLPNPRNPFFSTSNAAYHALKYAYGMKPYYTHRLTPRYRSNGRIEYSHVGKFYLSLHKVDRLLLDEQPHNVPQLDREGRIWLPPPTAGAGNIGPEKEFAFMAYMSAGQVVFQRVAKFPDFSGGYLPIYETKYGLNQGLFNCFQFLIQGSLSHSPLRQSVLDLLSEWLCAYNTTLLMYIAFIKVRENNGTLIYLGHDGLLTEEANKPLFTRGGNNKSTREDVHIHRSSRRMILH